MIFSIYKEYQKLTCKKGGFMLDIVKKDIKISIQNLERINLLPTFAPVNKKRQLL